MLNQVSEVWTTPELRAQVELRLFPYGNAAVSKSGKVECQHGPVECRGNVVEACGMQHLGWSDNRFMPYIECLEQELDNNIAPDDALKQCAYLIHDKAFVASMQTCVAGSEGADLVKKMAAATPKHTYVPWVQVNGAHSEDAENDLVGLVCKQMSGAKPKQCTEPRPGPGPSPGPSPGLSPGPSPGPGPAPAPGAWKWPVWPEEFEMVGRSIGPFPFWCDTHNNSKGAFKFLCLNRDLTKSSRTRILYSHTKMAQVAYREGCDLSHFGGEANVTCA